MFNIKISTTVAASSKNRREGGMSKRKQNRNGNEKTTKLIAELDVHCM